MLESEKKYVFGVYYYYPYESSNVSEIYMCEYAASLAEDYYNAQEFNRTYDGLRTEGFSHEKAFELMLDSADPGHWTYDRIELCGDASPPLEAMRKMDAFWAARRGS